MLRAPDGTVYEVAGSEEAPAVLLIHGLGLTRATWDGIIPYLQGFRVISYDLVGHGESAPPAEAPSLALFARQVVGLLDHLEISRAALVGFSLGGMINRRVAIDAPGRVSALAILNSPHDRGVAAQAAVEARARDSVGGAAATIEATLARWFTPSFHTEHADIVSEIREGVLANPPETYGQCRWVLAHGVRELIRPTPPISHPTLVMTAEHDTGSTPAMARAIAAEIDGAETVIIP
ncbi:MAG: alpha/beta fold hydrolase, partial [Pseudomonadota bacterium]